MQSVLDLENLETWPADLCGLLMQHLALFMEWETGLKNFSVHSFDTAINQVSEQLKSYFLLGWHCTRLTDGEIAGILANGVSLPDLTALSRRIDTLVAESVFSSEIALRLKRENQAKDGNRAGMFWLCFFEPALAGEGGIGRFFRHWGGEALYNSHEDDPETSPVLCSIGTPCIVVAEAPIASFRSVTGLTLKVIRRYLISRGFSTREPVDHEDFIVHGLPPENIRGIERFPSPEFMRLSGCADWKQPVVGGALSP